jgi:tetratricopeptide (TPR) repeat protein
MKSPSGSPCRFHLLSCVVLAGIVSISSAARGSAQQANNDPRAEARRLLIEGMEAYRHAEFDRAIEDFKKAKELDPWLANARLYLATAYATQYIPGASSEDNIRYGKLAIEEYKGILMDDPKNLSAIDGLAALLYNVSGTPFDQSIMEESKSYNERHIQIKPRDPEPHYWVGVIDWAIAYRSNKKLREEWNRETKQPPAFSQPLPEDIRQQFVKACAKTVDEGIRELNEAIVLQPDYDDAMAYLNLLDRQKADMEPSPKLRDSDLRQADELVDKIKAIKQRKMNEHNPPDR